jgi:hypothetical protein
MTSSDRVVAALAMAIAAFASMALVGTADSGRALAGPRRRIGDCEDGDCPTGTLPTEGLPSRVEVGDNESPSDSEGPDSTGGDDTEGAEPDSGSESVGVSDRRLKRDIRLLTTLDSGIKLYAFRYLWSAETHVGVMAQDLIADARYADAAIMTASGTYVVDYARLGLRMATLDAWNADGVEAVLLRARPADRLASLTVAAH